MTSGVLLHKGANGENETGIWICTPGYWNWHGTRDEFCHFIAGRATYRRDNGEVIEVRPGTCVHFVAGWTGDASPAVRETTSANLWLLPSGRDLVGAEIELVPLPDREARLRFALAYKCS